MLKLMLKFYLGIVAFLALLLFIFGKPYCANSLSCKNSFNLKIENGAAGLFDGQKVTAPAVDLAEIPSASKVLGEEAVSGEKHIYVDLTNQTITAKQGDATVLQAYIASGKWFPTPTGEFSIWHKVRATRMTGGKGADYYDLPNVPYVMFFAGSGIAQGRGFALHGAYWHNNFGHAMSHGCVNMRTVDVAKLYAWAEVGTKISIYGEAL